MGRIDSIKDKNEQRVKIVAQEIKFAKILAGNDKKLRDKTLKNLKKWFTYRSQSSIPITEEDFMRLWKGLFYCMWMSDKLLFQEEYAEQIADLTNSFTNSADAILFFKCFLQTMINEWFGIDQLRLNKFLMLVRRCLRQILEVIKKYKWNHKLIVQFGVFLNETVLKNSPSNPLGFMMHFVEIYLEELAKVSIGKLSKEITLEFIRPFAKQLAFMNDQRAIDHLVKFIFTYLIEQSNLGVEYAEKFEAWKARGFPGGNINCMKKVNRRSEDEHENSNEEMDKQSGLEEMPKDPRAGQVDVFLKQIPFDCDQIINLLKEYQFNKGTNAKSRSTINKTIDQFTKLNRGIYPFGITKMKLLKSNLNTQAAAESLIKFEEELYSDSHNNLLKHLTKSQKRKLRNQSGTEGKGDVEVQPKFKKRKVDSGPVGIDEELKKFIEKSERGLFTNGFDMENAIKMNKKKIKCATNNIKTNNNQEKLVKKQSNKVDNLIAEKKSKRLENKVLKAKKPFIIGVAQRSGIWEITDNSENKTGVTGTIPKINKEEKGININVVDAKTKCPKPETVKRKSLKPELTKKGTSLRSGNENINISKTKPSGNQMFAQADWDTSLQDGEVEIFIPAKKYHKNLEKKTKTSSKSTDQLLVKNPFAKIKKKSQSPIRGKNNELGRPKRVKIVLEDNVQQCKSEYIKQVKKSPAIPFDATKKPAKPLLKQTSLSPINPFYKLSDSFR